MIGGLGVQICGTGGHRLGFKDSKLDHAQLREPVQRLQRVGFISQIVFSN